MGRRRKGRDVHGILLLDKPAGISSNHALQKVRRLLNARKAGHTGTLDPFATGMLPICLGEASKTAAFMLEAGKSYQATARLGQTTTTGDVEGDVVLDQQVPVLKRSQIEAVLNGFSGRISQIPPMYSALKHKGQPLYKLAREGIEVEREPRQVMIHRLELLSLDTPYLSFEVHCSKGTYIRTLAEDICLKLGSCGHLQSLRRLEVEPFSQADMVTMEQVEKAAEENTEERILLPADAGIYHWPKQTLDENETIRFCHGNTVPGSDEEGKHRVYGPDGQILGLAENREDGLLHPLRVFVYATDNS
jgi:tRNA pseudouridine55 synthase